MERWYTSIKCRMQELGLPFEKGDKKEYFEEKLNCREEIRCMIEGILVVMLFSYFFYRSYIAVVFLSPLIFLYRKLKRKQIIRQKKEQLEQQFKETILAVQTNLQAGYSMENAFVESYRDIIRIYGEGSEMEKELSIIRKGMNNGNTLENLLLDLGRRCPESEIAEFAEVYSIACRTGSMWNEVISKTVSLISQKIEIKEEIEILVHGRKMESRVMCIIPFFILFYMDITSKGYFDVLYHNVLGSIIMTLCMMVYIVAYLLSEKITEIR